MAEAERDSSAFLSRFFVKLKACYMDVGLTLSLYELHENFAVGIRPVGHAE